MIARLVQEIGPRLHHLLSHIQMHGMIMLAQNENFRF